MKILTWLKKMIAMTLITLSLFLALSVPALASTSDNLLFKQLTDESYAAWNTQNPNAVAEFYLNDPNLVVYDATPLKYQGWQEFKSGIQTHLFDKLDRFELTAHDDLQATRNGDLVWVTFTYHLSAVTTGGQAIETEGRQTDLWQQHNGKWLIVHEHTSAPVTL